MFLDSEILSIKQSLLLLHNEIPRETFILVIDEIEALSGGSYLVANLRMSCSAL